MNSKMYICIVLSLLLASVVGQFSVCTQTASTTLTTAVTGNNFAQSIAYNTATGVTYSTSTGVSGTTSVATFSGWSPTGDNVLRATITTISGISTIVRNANSTDSVVIQNLLSVYYLGWKASRASVSVDLTLSATSASFVATVGAFGWQNGFNCEATCTKTLYQYTLLSIVSTPGLYECSGTHITMLVSALLVVLALLF